MHKQKQERTPKKRTCSTPESKKHILGFDLAQERVMHEQKRERTQETQTLVRSDAGNATADMHKQNTRKDPKRTRFDYFIDRLCAGKEGGGERRRSMHARTLSSSSSEALLRTGPVSPPPPPTQRTAIDVVAGRLAPQATCTTCTRLPAGTSTHAAVDEPTTTRRTGAILT